MCFSFVEHVESAVNLFNQKDTLAPGYYSPVYVTSVSDFFVGGCKQRDKYTFLFCLESFVVLVTASARSKKENSNSFNETEATETMTQYD